MRRWGRFGLGFLVACLLLTQTAGIAQAQDAGWYGPYDDGCYHWWDGFAWTNDVDCDGDGYTDQSSTSYPAGWYGPYDDGCYHWWDGNTWTNDVDCDGDGYTDVTTFEPGWYGPFDDGCYYWWDGSAYTGDYDCDGDGYTDDTQETYKPGWYDLYEDGCLYWYDGNDYTGEVDCNGDGKADTTQQPNRVDTSDTDEFIYNQVDAINGMWSDRFKAANRAYDNTHIILATEPVRGGCPTQDGDLLVETEDWIFYCPVDQTIYVGPGNLEKVVQAGVGSVQFMVAHEIGHHVQNTIYENFGTLYSSDTVKYEDQATCMAGVWFNELDRRGTPSDINQAMTYLSNATSETHGKGEDQVKALLKGYKDPNAC
jgi:hypothetical protein